MYREQESCPCCYDSHPLKVLPPTEMLMKVLGGVLITCSACKQKVRVSDLKTHAATKCGEGRTAEVMSITDILSKPPTVPPTTAEQQVASNVVRRMLSGHGETIRLPTAGQVRYHSNKEHIIILHTNFYSHLHLLMFQQPECPLQKPVAGQYVNVAVTWKKSELVCPRIPEHSFKLR